jgi:uncharacterized paraquat-inducible protein A
MTKKCTHQKCPDCDADVSILEVEEGEVVSCPSCGLELEYKRGKLQELKLDGKEDWGE